MNWTTRSYRLIFFGFFTTSCLGADVNTKYSPEDAKLRLALDQLDIDQAKRCIEQDGASPNLKNSNGLTPLAIAIGLNKDDLFNLLLQRKADPDIQMTADGNTVLMLAIQKGDHKSFCKLLEYGANPNTTDNHGTTPLMFAAYKRQEQMLLDLINHGAKVNKKNKERRTALLTMIADRYLILNEAYYTSRLKPLLEAGAKFTPEAMAYSDHLSHLILTCPELEDVIIQASRKLSSEHRGHIECHNKKANAILRKKYAVKNFNLSTVESILTSNADLNRIENGNTPLIKAVESGKIDAVRALLAAKVNTDIPDIDGNTPLIRAVQEKRIDIVKELLDARANKDIQNPMGYTALMIAADNICTIDGLAIFNMLINYGTDLEITNYQHLSVLGVLSNRRYSDESAAYYETALMSLFKAGAKVTKEFARFAEFELVMRDKRLEHILINFHDDVIESAKEAIARHNKNVKATFKAISNQLASASSASL